MQVMFNSQERTLREIVALAASSGWKVVKVTKTAAFLFGHIVAVPAAIPVQKRARAGSGSAFFEAAGAKTNIPQTHLDESIANDTAEEEKRYKEGMKMIERASSRCGTPTFGSRMELSSVEETLSKFGGGVTRSKGLRGGPSVSAFAKCSPLKPAVSLILKKKPSPLSVSLPRHSPPLPSLSGKVGSPRYDQSPSPAGSTLIQRRLSLAQLRPQSQQGPQSQSAAPPPCQPPLSPMSPRHTNHSPLSQRPSHPQLSQVGHPHPQSQSHTLPILPSLIPVRSITEPVTPVSHQEHHQRHPTPVMASSRRDSPRPIITRRSSYAQLPQLSPRKRSGTVIGHSIQTSNLNAGFGAAGNSGLAMGVSGSSRGGAFGGAVLRFEAEIDDQQRSGCSTRPQSPVVGGVSVLAAAGRIERGDFSRPPSP